MDEVGSDQACIKEKDYLMCRYLFSDLQSEDVFKKTKECMKRREIY